MSYRYQQLCAKDVQTLKQLLNVFGEAFGDMDAYQSAVPRDAYLRSLLAKPHFIALVAIASDKVVGGLAAYVWVRQTDIDKWLLWPPLRA